MGLLHIVGGGSIIAALTGGPEAAFAVYRQSEGVYPPAAGGVIGYFAYFLVVSGIAVTVVALWANWRNSAPGLALNTVIVGAVEIGLIVFLLVPGYLGILEASPGLVLFALAAVTGGIACKGAEDAIHT